MKNTKLGRPGSGWTNSLYAYRLGIGLQGALNAREQASYETYRLYCKKLAIPPANEHFWRLVNNTLPTV